MNSVILSIKPKYIEMMAIGKKRFEFRKTIFKKNNITIVYIYASAPISKIVGKFKIEDIIYGEPNRVWDLTKDNSGITYSDFSCYFSKKRIAYAIKIKDFILFNESEYLNISDFCGKKVPPQNFYYFNSLSLDKELDNERTQLTFDF